MADGICPFADLRLLPSTVYSPGYIDRVGFCDHAAGGFYTTLTDRHFWINAGYSVHFAISRRGQIAQLVNIFDSAFGQGRLGPTVTWPYYNNVNKPYRRTNPNYLLISTEHEDWELVNGVARAIPGSQWTNEEYEASLRLKRWCIDETMRVRGLDLMQYGIDSLTGHHMFDGVNRANCPGSFWRDGYRQRLWTQLSSGLVAVSPEEDDMLIRWGGEANPTYWHMKVVDEEQGVGARLDWQLPPQAKSIELEIYLHSGALDVMDGGSQGKAFYAEQGVYHGRVILDSGGNFWLKNWLGNQTVIDKMVCLGYYLN